MFSWILALLLALLIWSLVSAWLWLVKRRETERQHGLAALAGMRWREFSQIVRRAMGEQRGLRDLAGEDVNADRGTSTDFLMEKGGGEGKGERCLLSCKHGRAYRIGADTLNELGAAMRLTGAHGGILITEGLVERDGLAAAQKLSIEVMDARRLWPVLKPCVASDTREAVVGFARREAMRQTGIAALGALAFGLLVGMGYLTLQDENPAAAAPPAQAMSAPPAPAEAPPSADTPAPAEGQPANASPASPAPPTETGADDDLDTRDPDPDPATLQRYQQNISRALSRTPGVISGIWLTRSTLSVERSDDDDAVWPLICREVERYPALRTVRIQLNPRPGSNEPVRWRQCSTI